LSSTPCRLLVRRMPSSWRPSPALTRQPSAIHGAVASALLITAALPLGVTWRHPLMRDAVRNLLLPPCTRAAIDQSRLAGLLNHRHRQSSGDLGPPAQGHLRNVFAKTGVRTRLDLVIKIFLHAMSSRAAHSYKSAVAWRTCSRHPLPTLTPTDGR
jgi:hypothetical protein